MLKRIVKTAGFVYGKDRLRSATTDRLEIHGIVSLEL